MLLKYTIMIDKTSRRNFLEMIVLQEALGIECDAIPDICFTHTAQLI